MKPGVTTTIQYQKKDGTHTERNVIAVDVPADQIKAIDVTSYNGDACEELEALIAKYKEYKQKRAEKILTFEAWLDAKDVQFVNKIGELKWRTFKLDGISDEWNTNLDAEMGRPL